MVANTFPKNLMRNGFATLSCFFGICYRPKLVEFHKYNRYAPILFTYFAPSMDFQHRVILALGSNMGDRLAFIEQGILAIHQAVGTVVAVSRLYESDSWGFESDAFYNAAVLVHTVYDPERILSEIQSIESDAGRQRSQAGYAARNLDIDILSYDSEVISSAGLTVPHPLIQDRLFVLLPLADIAPNWAHPVSGFDIRSLIQNTSDKSRCVAVQKLRAPLDRFGLKRVNHIAIEGNIGAGKTTLTKRIAEDFNAKVVLERFADNPFLPKFYEDQARYAFPLEMSFLADRFQQIADDLSQFDLFRDFIISDYHLFKSLIFAKVTLAEEEFRLYRKLFDIIYREVPKPDLYVFLYQDTERLLQNIRKRGRSYEQQIPPDYLEKINRGYLEYIRSIPDTNVLLIDIGGLDFVASQTDYLSVLEQIDQKISGLNV